MDSVARVGEPAPPFRLADLNGTYRSLDESKGSIVVLNFWSAECIHSTRADGVIRELSQEWGGEIALWCIAANDSEDDDLIRSVADQNKIPRLLRDKGNKVADTYGAVTTPHVFVIDQVGVLRYAGCLDDVSLRQRTPTRNYLRDAVEAVRNGETPDPSETAPFGCAIIRHAL